MDRAGFARSTGLLLALGAALLGWSLWQGSPYGPRVLSLAGVYALLVLGYQFIFGQAGALSLAQGTFFGLGAYVAGILATRYGLGFEITFPLAILLPAALAALVASAVLRLASHYFALATLGIGQVVLLIAVSWQSVTGGATGLADVPGIVVLGMPLPRGWPQAAFVWGLVGVGALIAARLSGGSREIAFTTLREDPVAASASGIDAARLRFLAFLLSAAYGGAAGALHAHLVRTVSSQTLEFGVMITCLAMTVIGGRKRIAGALIGATLLVLLPEWLRFLADYSMLIYGAALLLMIVAAPDGLAGLLEGSPPAPRLPPPAPLSAARPGARIDIRDLAKRFGGVVALDGVSLTVEAGEILGLIGPNGSGKTTLVNLVTGLERADRGEIRLADAALMGLDPDQIARQGVTRTFQTPSLTPGLTALDTVAVARPGPLAEARAQALAFLHRLGVAGDALRLCGDLPPGSQRRVEIARALALDPAILLLDEPAAGLTEREQADLADRLRSLVEEGISLLVIEHNMPFLLGLADRVICLDRGRIIAEGPPDAIRRDPKVIAAYFGSEP